MSRTAHPKRARGPVKWAHGGRRKLTDATRYHMAPMGAPPPARDRRRTGGDEH